MALLEPDYRPSAYIPAIKRCQNPWGTFRCGKGCMSDRKTYGQRVHEHWLNNPGEEDDVIEYRRRMEIELIQKRDAVIEKAITDAAYEGKDFYIVMLFKVEKIGQATRTFVFARLSCPTPVYKQAVWKYHRGSGVLEFLWSIPDAILYYHVLRNQKQYLDDKETAGLAKFIILMESGELLEWVKKENGEKIDAIIKINQGE